MNNLDSTENKKSPKIYFEDYCCPSWIRTNIVGTKNRSPAVRRSGNFNFENAKILIF